jgi:glutathione S-transferase
MIRLHDNLSSGNGYKVRLLLAQLGIPFERIEYDIDTGETRTSQFLATVNPNGRVPVLELEDGTMLPESNAILFYLADGTPFLPEGRLERAQVMRWMFFEQYSQKSQNPCT